MAQQLNVGIIGVGMAFEKLHYPALKELSDRFKIVALCDTNLEKAYYWGKILGLGEENIYEDFHDMIGRKDIDLFDIMVPIPLNYIVTEEVARGISGTGKGIICEKPSASNLKDAEAHKKLPEKYNVSIMIAENYRYNDETNMIRDMVREKKIGDIYYFIYNRILNFPDEMTQDKFPAREWRQYPEYPGGAILDSGIHDLAALRHIFGAIDRLQAFGKPQEAPYSPYSVVTVNLLFKNGIPGLFSFFCAGKEAQAPFIGLRIFGTEGMIYLENRDCGVINIAYNNGTSEQVPYTPQRGYYNELLNFYNSKFHGEPLFVTPEMGYGDTKTVLDLLKSISEEAIIPVDEEPHSIQTGKAPEKTAVY
ncbi:MAG: Gfo/Idh/MocA family oxidoreductase [Firmicutes bacterium]|nr:Gfo/Idh/MocA family oxidoreductase [Bacillota bacterium]